MTPKTMKLRQPPITRDQFAALWDGGVPTREIAQRVGRSASNVTDWAKRFGLTPRLPGASTNKQPLNVSPEQFEAMWNRGDTIEEIGREIGMSRHGVSRVAAEMNLRRVVSHEERLPMIREEFVRLWNDSQVTCGNIANRFGVHVGTVRGWAQTLRLGNKAFFAPDRSGPLPGDPTPEEIAERAAECRARRGHAFVFEE